MLQTKILNHVVFTELIIEKLADLDKGHIQEIPQFLQEMILPKLFDHRFPTQRRRAPVMRAQVNLPVLVGQREGEKPNEKPPHKLEETSTGQSTSWAKQCRSSDHIRRVW